MPVKDPPQLTDPYATGSTPPPAPAPPRSSRPETPPPPAAAPIREPSLPSYPDLRSSGSSYGTPLPAVAGPPEAAPAPAPAPKKARWGLVLGVLGGLGALGGAGFGGWLWYRSRGAEVLPFEDVRSLPEATVAISRDDAGIYIQGLNAKELPPEATWSRLGTELCGGTDVFRLLMRPSWKYAKVELARAFEERRSVSGSLSCGREMAKKLESTTAHEVTLALPEDENDRSVNPSRDRGDPPKVRTARVRLHRVAFEKLPDTSRRFHEARDRGGLTSTHCLSLDERGRRDDCLDYAPTSARLEGTNVWLGGPFAAVSVFGREFSPKGTNKIEDAEAWTRLAGSVRGYAYAELGTHQAFNDGFIYNTGFGHGPSEIPGLADAMVPLSEAVEKYKARWALGDNVGNEGGELRLELMAEGDGDAIDLLLDVREWHSGFKTHVAKGDTGGDDAAEEDMKRVERDFYAVLHESGKKALDDASIERDGRRVIFVAKVAYSEEDKRKLEAMRDLARSRAATAAKIVIALADGDKPDESLMRDLGGSDYVDILKDPEKARRDLTKERSPRRE